MRAYSPIVPMTSEDLWPKCHRPPLMPPFYHKQPGRPRKKRMRPAGEQPRKSNPTTTKLQRYNLETKCSLCRQKGHNMRGCPRAKESTSSQVCLFPKLIWKICFGSLLFIYFQVILFLCQVSCKSKVKKTIDTTSTKRVTRQSRAKQPVNDFPFIHIQRKRYGM